MLRQPERDWEENMEQKNENITNEPKEKDEPKKVKATAKKSFGQNLLRLAKKQLWS